MSSIHPTVVERSNEGQSPTEPTQTELLERLRGAQGPAVRASLLDQLMVIERRLAQEASQLQPANRMRQIETARLAVQTASAILARIRVEPTTPLGGDLPAPQHLFRGASHDQ